MLQAVAQKFSSLSLLKKSIIITVPILYIIAFIVLKISIGNELTEIISDKNQFKEYLSSFGIYGELVFVIIRAVQTVIKIVPAEPLEIGAGYIWGTYKGLALCMIGTEIGSFFILLLTSIFGTRLLNMLFDTNKINEWSFVCNSKKKYLLLTVIYLIPGTPKDFITYFVGITDTKIVPFLLLTGVARIPSIISSTWCGTLLDTKSLEMFIAMFALITILSSIATYLFTRGIKKKTTIKS